MGSEGKNKSLLEVNGTDVVDWFCALSFEDGLHSHDCWCLNLDEDKDKISLFKDHQASQTLKMDPLVTFDPVLWGRGLSNLSLLVSRY